uniref:Serine/threonine-protein kinase 1 n=1 Tax=Gouania willdenowi TaxID=441366 RepID=A0A8C5HP03_GOUWI
MARIPQSEATAEEMLVQTPTSKKRKAEEELKDTTPSKKCCLDNHEVQERKPRIILKSRRRSSPEVQKEKIRTDCGFGSVFAGTRIADEKDVAIKHIARDKVNYMMVKFQDQYSLEISEVVLMAQAAGHLNQGSVSNPGVIGLVDVFELENEVLIITELSWCEMDMNHFYGFKNEQISEHEAKIIFKQLIDVSVRMHKNGVFHSDIKGGNILVSVDREDPSVKIIDFGCGDWVTEKPYETYFGPIPNAPPEFFLQYNYQAEQATVWQIGLVLWSYYCEGVFKLTDYIKNPNLPVNHLSHDGKDFLKRCLTIDPNQRSRLEDLKLHPWLN